MKKLPNSVKDANEVWKAISQPNRWAILEMIVNKPGLEAREIQWRLKLHQSTVSTYMKLLIAEGIVVGTGGGRGSWRTDPLRYTIVQSRWNSIKEAIAWLNRV